VGAGREYLSRAELVAEIEERFRAMDKEGAGGEHQPDRDESPKSRPEVEGVREQAGAGAREYALAASRPQGETREPS
jgi:hypothetical protein